MTKAEDEMRLQPTTARRRGETPEERKERYAHNAAVEAELAVKRARASRRGARLNQNAADNARRNGDAEAARLYTAIAEAQADIADAHEEIAEKANALASHYTREQEKQ